MLDRTVRMAGFTLIEIMVVIAIMGLILALVVSRGPAHSPTLTLRAAAGEVAEALRAERGAAIVAGKTLPFRVDPAARTYGGLGAMQGLPRGVTIAAVARPPGPIIFQPDGSASSGTVGLALGELAATVTVDWLTGRVSVGPVHSIAQH